MGFDFLQQVVVDGLLTQHQARQTLREAAARPGQTLLQALKETGPIGRYGV